MAGTGGVLVGADDNRARLDAVLRNVLRSALRPFLQRINAYLMLWIRRKYKRLRRFRTCWEKITTQHPHMFAHWPWTHAVW